MPKVIEDANVYRAVMQVIADRGFAGATTKQMADAANVSEVTLFRKYKTKAELVKQAISFVVEQTDFSTAAQYTGDIHADLLRVVQAYSDSAVKHGYFFAALFSEMSRYPEIIEALGEPLEIFSAVRELVAQYQIEGTLREDYPAYTAAALLGPLMYTALMRGAIPNTNLPAHDLSTYVTFFLEGYQSDYDRNC